MNPQQNRAVVKGFKVFFSLFVVYYVLRTFFFQDMGGAESLSNHNVHGPHHPIRGAAPFDYPEHCFQMGSKKACYKIDSNSFRNPCFTANGDSTQKLCLPFFSLIGFPGSKAEEIVSILSQHPQIQFPKTYREDAANIKSGLMNQEGIGIKAYASNFPYITSPQEITGEIALSYATSISTPRRLKQIVPYLRVIVLVRDPIDQLKEVHSYMIQEEFDNQQKVRRNRLRTTGLPFDEFVRDPELTTKCFEKFRCGDNGENWNVDCSRNCRRLGDFVHVDWLQEWYKYYKDQMLVIRVEDFEKEPDRVMRMIEEHLFIQKNNYDFQSIMDIQMDLPKPGDYLLMRMAPKKTAKPRVKTMDYRIQNPLSIEKVGYNYSSVDIETRQLLRLFYQPHIQRLEEFLQRPLHFPKPEEYKSSLAHDTKNHCFLYKKNLNACYNTGNSFKNPCFYVQGERRCIPYFIIIGWPKSGTSSLYYYITQHPYALSANVKETDYFQHWIRKGAKPEYYSSLFPVIRHPEMITGEATSKYGHNLHTATNMIEMLPHVKLIAMLRDPTEQIYSNHLMNNDVAKEHGGKGMPQFEDWLKANRPFDDCLKKAGCKFTEPEQWKPDCTFNCMKFGSNIYVDWLEHWFKVYPREQIMVILTEELEGDPKGVVEKVRRFLGLPAYDFSTILRTVVNVRGAQRGIYSVVEAAQYNDTRQIGDAYTLETRLQLARFYHPHNMRLARLLGRPSLPWWTPSEAEGALRRRDAA